MRSSFGLACAAAMTAAWTSAHGQAATPAPVSPAVPSAGAAVTVLQRVCLPLIDGGNLKAIAKATGMKQEHGQWILRIDRQRRVELDPPDPTNPRVCDATIIHAVGAQPYIRRAIDDWARAESPPLTPVKVAAPFAGPSFLRTTSTWEGRTAKGALGVVLSEEKTLQGKPVDGDLDRSELLVSLTPG